MEGFNSQSIHGGKTQSSATSDVVPPIHLSASYEFDSVESAAANFSGNLTQFVYGRVHNPTQSLLEERLALLEGAESSIVTASGMSAISCLIFSFLNTGDTLLYHNCAYGNTVRLFSEALPRFGINAIPIDLTVPVKALDSIPKQTKMLFLESPSNPNLEVLDLELICKLSHDRNIMVVVDNTFMSPFLQTPIKHGADFVVHSLTKYIGGHGDLLGGAVISKSDYIKQIRSKGMRFITSPTLSPFNAYLAIRGLKTLGIRMERHCLNALRVAEFLFQRPDVLKVHYPGLSSHPQSNLVLKYMPRGQGGIVSFELDTLALSQSTFLNSLSMIKLAVSLGGCETLIQHPCLMTHSGINIQTHNSVSVGENLVRLSLGLENTEDIITDLKQAFSAASSFASPGV